MICSIYRLVSGAASEGRERDIDKDNMKNQKVA